MMDIEADTYEDLLLEAKRTIDQHYDGKYDNNGIREQKQPINVTINFNYDKFEENTKELVSRVSKVLEESIKTAKSLR